MKKGGVAMTGGIGVVGAGTIGAGVAHAFAAAGRSVVLVDLHDEALAAARRRIGEDARFSRLVVGSTAAPEVRDVLDMIICTVDIGALAKAEYVVENITERIGAKQDLYRELDQICAGDCILAANTSAIPITTLAGCTRRPDRVLGNHFMNPAHLMPVVEVIRGFYTSEETLRISRELLASIGKDSVVVADSPGFVTNRVLMLTVNEAIFLLQEGGTTARDIDQLFRRCFGHRMGPLETADLIGLDTVLYSLEVLVEQFGDPKYRPCPLLRQYVAARRLGRKCGHGFHQYDGFADISAAGEAWLNER
jgi:3-hydroxybutyryl-CoA dehydrogenase